ncbi:kinesin-related protein 3-like [Scyliorhinus canicula]|uniref:kinesin-related protein 3-like n=1 Tax=Scyliorhinus canicula TaxID=7830 RepID=UPI0018F69D82|nr:kinesin-related protein 3-like [Scyliorhinus canicula]XP_038630153.1 kinesin-related protein 3-like [Scyliorhinus canicula]XP_038630155.1 kinesin-related protein 3-like [Scyliorhinus canicula]
MADPVESIDLDPLEGRNLLPTTVKGGTGIPDVSVEDMLGDFGSFFRKQFDLCETSRKIESKYNIRRGQWSFDNIKRAWGKSTRLHSAERVKWSLAIMGQLRRQQEIITKNKTDHEYRTTKDQLIAVVEELQDAKAKLESDDETRTDLENKISELQQLPVQIAEVQNQIFEVELKNQKLQSKTEQIEFEKYKLIEEKCVLEKELRDAEFSFEQDDAKFQQLSVQLAEFQNQIFEVELKNQKLQAKTEQIELEKYKLIEKNCVLERELRDVKSKFEQDDELRTELQNKTSKLQQLSVQIEFQDQIFDVESRYKQLQSKTDQTELENSKLIEEKCVLEKELQDTKAKLEHYDEIGTELQNKTSKLQQLSSQIAELQNQIFTVESKYQKLQSKTERIELEKYKVMEQKCVLERELQDAESKLEHDDEIGTELQNKTSKLQKLSIQTAELQDQIFEVESRYQRLQSKTERIEYDNCKLIEERYV